MLVVSLQFTDLLDLGETMNDMVEEGGEVLKDSESVSFEKVELGQSELGL